MTNTLRAPSANSICRNGLVSVIWNRLSSSAAICAVSAAMVWPNGSFLDQRRTEATASLARTGWPSWNVCPSRRVNTQVSPSGETSARSTACGCGTKFWSIPNNVSHTM